MKITHATKPARTEDVVRTWHLIDVKGKILGRVVGTIATLLQGKHKATFAPNIDGGDYVVVVNASSVAVTGRKLKTKVYTQYSGYPGGLREQVMATVLKQKPADVIKRAVSGMLPKNKLRDKRMTRLYVFADAQHPYENKFKK